MGDRPTGDPGGGRARPTGCCCRRRRAVRRRLWRLWYGRGEVVTTAGAVHGFPAVRTSFIGRAGPVREVAVLLERYRLVTVTGPGGSGKTRLAGEVARQVAGRFEDGAWLVELALVQDPDQVPAVVAAALGVREQPGVPAAVTLARVLARQQLLLVLDNCEHVISTAAGLCAELVAACDELRVLATSREALQVAGEARYRLGPLAVPDPYDLADAAKAEAVMLFADRARQADAHFVLDGRTGPQVARLVARLDGMPLAIELAAARVEALGVGQLLDRLDDRFALLAGGDRLAPSRQRSLAAAVEWSYQLLDEPERRAFRAVSVFPGPFTLDGAEAVAGAGAGLAVLQDSSGEAAAARRLDAENPTTRQVLAWALEHDPAIGLRLAVALARMVVPAGPAGRPVPTAVRDSRACRGGERGLVRRPNVAWPGCAVRGGAGWGAGPLHRGPRRRGGPGAVPGAGRCPGPPVVDLAEPGPARRGDRGGPPLAGHGPGTRLLGRRGDSDEDPRHRRLVQRRL